MSEYISNRGAEGEGIWRSSLTEAQVFAGVQVLLVGNWHQRQLEVDLGLGDCVETEAAFAIQRNEIREAGIGADHVLIAGLQSWIEEKGRNSG